ncbi:hypothetical protein AAVH_25519 [Aphelenchoides avenae]|nr:hypothetical protein AAVH_25519 [Aphelenchus avenae]
MFPCSYCRLKQCFAAGMAVPGVYSFTDLAAVYGLKNNGESPLRDVAAIRQALSVSRVRTLAEFGVSRTGARAATHPALSAFYSSEIRLLENFLHARNEIHGFLLSNESLECSASDFFPTWTVFETLVLTAKHLGFLKHQLHMVDGSVINLNINDLTGYCSTIPNVRDPQSVARLCLDKFSELLDFSANLHRAGADDVEIAALFELVFAHYASTWFEDASARTTFINGVLKDLEFHYAQNGGDVATRMGAMMALFGEFHHVQQLCEECHVIVELCSYISECKPHIARDGTVVRAPRGILT